MAPAISPARLRIAKCFLAFPSKAAWRYVARLTQPLVPNSKGVIVAQYPAPCYSGQYSEGAYCDSPRLFLLLYMHTRYARPRTLCR